MLDIVVGTESNLNRKLYRTRIVINRNRNIENRREILKVGRGSNRRHPDRAAHSIGAPGRSAATFLFWSL